MPTLKYKDELTHESDNIIISYVGKEPFRIRRHVENILKTTLEIDSPKFYLHYINYDLTDGRFKAEWQAHKPWDRWTSLSFIVRCWGQQYLGDPEKNGWFKMKFIGSLDTSYDYTHSIQKSLWWSYNYIFYNKVRSAIFEEGRDFYYRALIEFKKLYGIYQKEPTLAPKL